MIRYHQGTVSRNELVLPNPDADPHWGKTKYEITRKKTPFLVYRVIGNANPTRSARQTVRLIKNRSVAKDANKLLDLIDQTLVAIAQHGKEIDHLLPLHAVDVNDGSVLFEWTFANFRAGFSIEPDPTESGWYLILQRKVGQKSREGR